MQRACETTFTAHCDSRSHRRGGSQTRPYKTNTRRETVIQSYGLPADFSVKRSRTLSLSALPSTALPSSLARAAFTTAPICFSESAPDSEMASSMARRMSSSLGAAGKYCSIIFISLASLSARSWRPPWRELFDGFLALLDESLQDLQGLHIVERAHFVDFLELERAFDHAQDAQAQLVLFLHGGGKIALDAVNVSHSVVPRFANQNSTRISNRARAKGRWVAAIQIETHARHEKLFGEFA